MLFLYAAGKRCRIYQTSRIKKRCYISHHCLTKGLKGTVGNQACPSYHGGALEVKTTLFVFMARLVTLNALKNVVSSDR